MKLHLSGPVPRFASLDSLRGIAALGVVITHVLQYGFPALALNHTPLRMLVNGRCFVIFFFVLSGFVLSIGLLRTDGMREYPLYLLRRFARIYLPYLAAGLIAVWAASFLGDPATMHQILGHFFLSGTSSAG